MKITNTYNVQIWVGLRKQYSDVIYNIDHVREICKRFVNDKKDCVTITPTEFVYVDGGEPGVIVGFIHYPRFERTEIEIKNRALELAEILMTSLDQYRVTVTTPDYSIMLENDKL